MIAPSKNCLQEDVYKQIKKLDLCSIPVEEAAKQNGLEVPAHYPTISKENHCVAMSLDFIKQFQENENIQVTAKAMEHGANEDCARCSTVYHALLNTNDNAKVDGDVLLGKLRNAAANLLGLRSEKEMILDMPLREMVDHLKNKTENGEYLIKLPRHIVAVIKNSDGLFLYDPNQGTINLTNCEPSFISFLEKYKIHRTETLAIVKIERQQTKSYHEGCVKEKISSTWDAPPLLSKKPLNDRWEIAALTFRGKTFNFVKDKHSGYIYNDNTTKLLRFKFCLLTPRNLIDAAARTTYHVAMTIFNVLKIPFALVKGREQFYNCVKRIKTSAADIFRAPLFGVLGTFAAFYGIFKPYEGRALYGYLERSLNRQNYEVDRFSKYYVAPCFVPLNYNLHDKQDEGATISVLKTFTLRSTGLKKRFLFDLFCGWTKSCCG